MLAPDAEADEPGGDPAQDGQRLEQAQREWHTVKHGLAYDKWRKDARVDHLLRALNDPRRKHSPLLDRFEQGIDVFAPR